MPRSENRITLASLEKLYEKLEKAYVEWKNCPGGYGFLDHERALAMRGAANVEPSSLIKKHVKSAYDSFDQAIFKLVSRSKRAIGDRRIIERIRQAELPWFDDKQFFEQLGDALKKNTGMHSKTSKRKDIAELYWCADDYRNGNEAALKECYEYWETFDIDARRHERPNDGGYQAMIDSWEITKYSIVGGIDGQEGGYKAFKDRVKTLARALDKRGVPVSTSTSTSEKTNP